MKIYNPKLLLSYTISFFFKGFLKKRSEEIILLSPTFSVLSIIFIFTILSVTINFYLPNINFLLILLGVSGFSIIQVLLVLFISFLFKITDKVRYMFFTKIGYLYTSCLWLFPLLILYHYSFKSTYILSFFVIVLMITNVILILKDSKKLILSNLLYFILYLCTLELAPLLIVYKTIGG